MAVSAPSDGSVHVSLREVLTQKLVEEVLGTLPRWHSDTGKILRGEVQFLLEHLLPTRGVKLGGARQLSRIPAAHLKRALRPIVESGDAGSLILCCVWADLQEELKQHGASVLQKLGRGLWDTLRNTQPRLARWERALLEQGTQALMEAVPGVREEQARLFLFVMATEEPAPLSTEPLKPEPGAPRPALELVTPEQHQTLWQVLRRIVGFLGAGIDERHGGVVILAHVQGHTLEHLLEAQPPTAHALLPGGALAAQVQLLKKIMGAVGACHAAGIVHTALSPRNILVAEERGVWEPTLIDFGLSGLDTRPVAEKADISSLGALFLRLLTGSEPLEGALTAERVRRQCEDAKVPARLTSLLRQMLASLGHPARGDYEQELQALMESRRETGRLQALPEPRQQEPMRIGADERAHLVMAKLEEFDRRILRLFPFIYRLERVAKDRHLKASRPTLLRLDNIARHLPQGSEDPGNLIPFALDGSFTAEGIALRMNIVLPANTPSSQRDAALAVLLASTEFFDVHG